VNKQQQYVSKQQQCVNKQQQCGCVLRNERQLQASYGDHVLRAVSKLRAAVSITDRLWQASCSIFWKLQVQISAQMLLSYDLSLFSSVSPDKCWGTALNYATTASFHILSYSPSHLSPFHSKLCNLSYWKIVVK
jgi:hypothetical protein